MPVTRVFDLFIFSQEKMFLNVSFIFCSGSIAADYELIDTWMLGKRYAEAIEQNKEEMDMFLSSCRVTIGKLVEEVEARQAIEDAIEADGPSMKAFLDMKKPVSSSKEQRSTVFATSSRMLKSSSDRAFFSHLST